MLTAQLKALYREDPAAIGLSESGRLMEVFASPDGRTWTIVMTTPDGLACIMAAGKNWDVIIPPGVEL